MKLSTGACICLITDIIAFIVSSMIIMMTSSIFLIIIFAILNFVLAWDAYKATMFLIKYHNHKKRHQ